MAALTLPDRTVLTRISRADVLARINAITLGVIPYNQGVVSKVTRKRSDCTGWVSYCWATPDKGPGIYLNAYNTASFYTQKVLVPIDWADLLPGDTVGYFSPSSPGNGGHAAIWTGGDKRPAGSFQVVDHGSGMGPKRRTVKWDGKSTGWMHPDHIGAWRYVGLIEDDGTTYEPSQSLKGDEDVELAKVIQTALFQAGYNIGTSGPNKDGVDGDPGAKTLAALTAAFTQQGSVTVVDQAAIDAAVRDALAKVQATTTLTLPE